MIKNNKKIMIDFFNKKMKESLPDFASFHEKSEFINPGEAIYYSPIFDSVYLFIILVPNLKSEAEFTIEVGWSKMNKFPELSIRPWPKSPNNSEEVYKMKEYVCRLSQFDQSLMWFNISDLDYSWNKLQSIGIPFLRNLSK
jgi:hypothetical protein